LGRNDIVGRGDDPGKVGDFIGIINQPAKGGKDGHTLSAPHKKIYKFEIQSTKFETSTKVFMP
jgi:hypothetical protein